MSLYAVVHRYQNGEQFYITGGHYIARFYGETEAREYVARAQKHNPGQYFFYVDYPGLDEKEDKWGRYTHPEHKCDV